MIVYDLRCEHDHRFEGWFGSSIDYEDQLARGLLVCPECGSVTVEKAPMAPAVAAKRNGRSEEVAANAEITAESNGQTQDVSNRPVAPEVTRALKVLAKAQAEALKDSTWVGKDFAKRSRDMHYGDSDKAAIHGQASLEDAQALADEGVPVAPLPFPVAPPEELN